MSENKKEENEKDLEMLSEDSLKNILQHDAKDDPRDCNGDAPSWNKSYTGNS